MKRNDLLSMCSNYYNASSEIVFDMLYREKMCVASPAATGIDNAKIVPKSEESDGKLNVTFFGSDGFNALTTHSRYVVGDYVYVREAYFKNDGMVCYIADNGYDAYRHREKVISSRYMPKSVARIFFCVEKVTLRRIKDIRLDEVKKFGFANFTPFFKSYDASLSEREWEYSRSELNPYVFIYEVRMEVPDERKVVFDRSSYTAEWYKENCPKLNDEDDWQECSRKKQIADIREAAKVEPAFGRLLDLVLEKEKKNA